MISAGEFDRAVLEGSLPARFTDKVNEFPNRLAVRSRTHSLTYAELDEVANGAAAQVLERRGEGSDPVALLFAQGASLAAAVLAVLKAGKVYLPLDASAPTDRLRWILEDAGATLLVADEVHARLGRALAEAAGVQFLLSDSRRSAQAPEIVVAPDDLAYLYYTSGSTGRPKGVVDTHRNVLHNVMRYTKRLGICPDDRLSLIQAPAFSGSASSLFGALLNGASVFPIELAAEGVEGLAGWIERGELTIYHSVPAIFRRLVATGRVFPRIRLVRLEGDQAMPRDAELFQQRFDPGTLLSNGLGATECGLVRQFFVDHDTVVTTPTLPIGYPVDDVEVLILGEDGAEVTPGGVGEIVVRSAYLSPGYWRRPERTAEAFETDPEDGALRRYRTGDLGRLHEDGCLEYLGRLDAQAKVRGERVELESVENELVTSGLAREAAASVRSSAAGEPRLVAVLVPGTDPPPSRTQLRRRLALTLPAASIPQEYVLVDALPLTEHGKLDRAALGSVEGVPAPAESPAVAPRDLVEHQLVDVWHELLDARPIGVQDDFLDLGGDSLLAAAMLARLEELLGISIPASLLLRHGTVETLAMAISQQLELREESVVPVFEDGVGAPFFFAHGDVFGGGLYCRRLLRPLAPDREVHAIAPPRRADGLALPTMEEAAAERADVIEALRPSGPVLVGGGGLCSAGGLLAFEIARQLLRRGREVPLLVLVSTWPIRPRLRVRLAYGAIRGGGRIARIDPSRQAELFLRLQAVYRLFRRNGPQSALETTASVRHRVALAPYGRMEDAYFTRLYPGRVALVWPRDAALVPGSDPGRAWRRVAPQTDVVDVPGDHESALVEHAEEVGSSLRALLSPGS